VQVFWESDFRSDADALGLNPYAANLAVLRGPRYKLVRAGARAHSGVGTARSAGRRESTRCRGVGSTAESGSWSGMGLLLLRGYNIL
jgi:hypothetical protein